MAIEAYRGINVQTPDPTGAGGLRLQANQKILADRTYHLEFASAPTADDDAANTGGRGIARVGTRATDTATGLVWLCVDDTTGAASWVVIAGADAVADTASTTCYVGLFEAATGSIPPKTDGGLTYNAATGVLTATGFAGPLTGAVTGNVTGNATGSSGSCTGNAATATALATGRTIGGVSFDGTANIVPGTITVADTADTTCSVALFESATGDLGPKSDAGLTYNAGTGVLTATGFSGPLTGDVTGNCSGTAATVTGATQSAITLLGTQTQLNADNLRLDGNTLSSQNTNGNISLTPNGTGGVVVGGASFIDDFPTIEMVKTITETSASSHGITDSNTINSGRSYASFSTEATIVANAGLDYSAMHMAMFQANASYANAGNIATIYGFTNTFINNGGNVGTFYGARVNNPAGTGTYTNKYGFYSDVISGATTNNWQFFAAGTTGKSYIGGRLGINCDATLFPVSLTVDAMGTGGQKAVVVRNNVNDAEIFQMWSDATGDGQLYILDSAGNADAIISADSNGSTFKNPVAIAADSTPLRFGEVATDYTIQWNGSDAVHTITAGDFVFTGGNVGINTTATSGLLHVQQSIAANAGIFLDCTQAADWTRNILFRAKTDGAGAQYRNYTCWQDPEGNDEWLMGHNGAGSFILFNVDDSVHAMESHQSADGGGLKLNATGAGGVLFNSEADANTSIAGVKIYTGGLTPAEWIRMTPAEGFKILQQADSIGMRLFGYDDKVGSTFDIEIDSFGQAIQQATGTLVLSAGGSVQLQAATGASGDMYFDAGDTINFRDRDNANAIMLQIAPGSSYFIGNLGFGGETTPLAPVHILSNASHKALYLEENSGSEYWEAGINAAGDLIFYDTGVPVITCEDGTGVVELGTALKLGERSADPAEPAEGKCVIWMSDGTGKGDDGDVLIASKAGGVTKWGTLFDHSAGAAW
uniref:Putative tail protein n=1 Tax=viral metagenome TaxID=1070528 RepID=A0A6M3L661_9ZZZZ